MAVSPRIRPMDIDCNLRAARDGDAEAVSQEQVLPAFSDAVVADAHEKAKALVHQPYLPLEARA
jgi:hypothetical protein